MPSTRRIVTFLIFLALFSASYQVGAISEVDEEEAQAFVEEFEEIIKGIDAIGIFLHNISIALPMFIPGFGIGWGFFSSWSTGYAFASITSLNPTLYDVPPLALLFLSPFGLMELAAYSIGMSRSFLLINKLLSKISVKNDVKVISIEIGLVVGLLLAGGFIEFYLISLVQEAGMGLPGF